MTLRRYFLLLTGLLLTLIAIPASAQENASPDAVIYLFWGDGCPHCAREHAFLDDFLPAYPNVELREYEIWYNAENRALLMEFGEVFGFTPGSVPTTFIGDQYWVGFSDSVARQMVAAVDACIADDCDDVGSRILSGGATETGALVVESAAVSADVIAVPLMGDVTLADKPLWLSTGLIAFVDGFNPCSLWVLSILLGLVLHSGSRRRVLMIGLTFLTVTSAVYVVFIAGLFGALSIVGYMGWIQIGVAALAFAFALINIKDYFWYKEGVSLTIDDRHKPGLYRSMRGVMTADKAPLAAIGATAVMAAGVTLLELPCTSGLPVIWTSMIVANNVPGGEFALLLALYMLIFLIDELILFLTVVFTLKIVRFEEKHGRILKLGGGVIMFALAAVMLLNPELMNDLSASLLVFGAAVALTAVILVLHRRVLPAFNIYIGSEMTPKQQRRKSTHKRA